MPIKNHGNIRQALMELQNDRNNAVAHIYPEAQSGKGALASAIVTLKDVYATADAPLQGSSRILEDFEPHYDAEVVTRLRKAGAAIVAKTHTDELALGGTGTYSAWGVITNPLDSQRLVGGSSAGAAATFTKSITLAMGSDTGDSVRLPASYVGVNGFKPSYGAISRYGLLAFASSLDTVGYFAHNVNDLVVASQVLFGHDKRDFSSRLVPKPTLKALKPRSVAMLENTEFLAPQVRRQYEQLKDILSSRGIAINSYRLNPEILSAIDPTYMVISFSEASSNNANLNGLAFGKTVAGQDWREVMTNTRSRGFGRMVQRRFALGAFYLQAENQERMFRKAQQVRRVIVNTFNDLYRENDLLLFPAANVAPKINEGKAPNWYSAYLTHANLSGNPSLSLRWIREGEMPVNLAIDAPLYRDKELLSYALYLEKIMEGQDE